MKFSANLGFLWTELPLPDAIRAAHAAGFDAVECHWPYDVPIADVKAALDDTGLPMLGLNTRCGDVAMGDNGLSALPDRKAEAQRAIEQAITYATAIGASSVHVMAGNAQGQAAHDTFIRNLMCATEMANAHCIEILIEPLNGFDAPGYFLNSLDQAGQIIDEVGRDNLKLMFDCYHVARMGLDVIAELDKHLPRIGHIQFAGV
ncbi:MAG: hydroxypyruvate isomerase family protein, partial [Planktomarina sp.]